jgi:hypothetical protein
MIVHFVIAFVITLLAAFGIMMIHYNGLMHPDSLGIGMGAFALVGAFMLYQIWFRRR